MPGQSIQPMGPAQKVTDYGLFFSGDRVTNPHTYIQRDIFLFEMFHNETHSPFIDYNLCLNMSKSSTKARLELDWN